MFKLSRKGEYAVRTVLHLSMNADKSCTTEEIAKAQDIPLSFLKKIIQVLRVSGITSSSKGQKGGISLSVPPEKLTVADVIEKIEGPLYLNDCLVKKGACPRDEVCPVHEMWRTAQSQVLAVWKAHNFKDMADRQAVLASRFRPVALGPSETKKQRSNGRRQNSVING
ncbi:MAG: Rrf2 family transcriptional regulator [Nitrospinae bacterium]|nr:Rrf2 family transcriptional regulator [Nitrospinota bacterium]